MSGDLLYGASPTFDAERPTEAVGPGGDSSPLGGGRLARVVVPGGSADTVEVLLLSVARGDPEALVALESRRVGLVCVRVRRVWRDGERCETTTEQAFEEVPEYATHFAPQRDSAQTWLLTRGHQRAMDGLRSVGGTDDPLTATPSQSVAGSLPLHRTRCLTAVAGPGGRHRELHRRRRTRSADEHHRLDHPDRRPALRLRRLRLQQTA